MSSSQMNSYLIPNETRLILDPKILDNKNIDPTWESNPETT